MQTITVQKGQILQHEGDLRSKVYHVKSGLLRSYTIDKNGKEHIFMFAPEGWVIADAQPPETTCDLYIDALEDSTVAITEKIPGQENHDEGKLIKRISVLQKRVLMLLSSSAIERYNYFLETYPNITQRVPQKMIASFIGITPQALSTIRKDRVLGKK